MPIVTLSVSGVTLFLYVFPDSDCLAYFPGGRFELWRIFTCHCIHWNTSHLFWSLGVFLVLGVICENDGRIRFLACFLVSTIVIPIVLSAAASDLRSYGGLSGLDSALFVMLVVVVLRDSMAHRDFGRVVIAASLLAANTAKICFELITGDLVFVQNSVEFVPVPMAHVAGSLVGAGIAMLWPPWTNLNVRKASA